jgi:class 3 adenylate cyclase
MTAARRLAAILAADVVGYSRLMGEDEAGTAKIVRERREAAAPIVAAHGGRVFKTMGDGILIEFASVVAAVECALAMQKQAAERNAEAPEAKSVVYRIGVHLGDVLVDGEDVLGDGVNIATRLEGVAEPGGVCVSGSAFDHVRGRVEAEFIDLGEKALKNIARPVRVYALEVSEIARASASRARASLHRGAALHQSVERPEPGLLRRRDHRKSDDGLVAHPQQLRHRPQYRLHLQGQEPRRQGDRQGA